MTISIKLCKYVDFDEEQCLRIEHPQDDRKSILIIKKDGALYAYENVCPHYSIPLDYKKGIFHTYRDEVVMCAHHSAMFIITTGECIEGPCKGHALIPMEIDVKEGVVYLVSGE